MSSPTTGHASIYVRLSKTSDVRPLILKGNPMMETCVCFELNFSMFEVNDCCCTSYNSMIDSFDLIL